jgi:hypothetical protein
MDHHKIMVAAGVGGAGLVAVFVLRRRAAANAAASAASSADNGAASLSNYVSSGLGSVSTGVSTGGMFSFGGGSSVDTTDNSVATGNAAVAQSNSSTTTFASLLSSILATGSTITQQSQNVAQQNNAAAVAGVNSAAPAPAPTPAAPAVPITDRNLVERVGNYLVANTGLYANDATYKKAWDTVSSNNQNATGTDWNRVDAASYANNASGLAQQLSDIINPNWRTTPS